MKRWFERWRGKPAEVEAPPALPLTRDAIFSAESDEALLGMLCAEIQRQVPSQAVSYDDLGQIIKTLPPGLRAMAAIHPLDVSLALDDLRCHFVNFPSLVYADETLAGLQTLGFSEFAVLFEQAIVAVSAHWERFQSGEADPFLGTQLEAITGLMWELLEQKGLSSLMDTWPAYARTHPEQVLGSDEARPV